MNYADFLKNKIKLAPVSGLHVDPQDVNPILKPHQRDMVVWAVRGGKRAIFAAFGLGKSVIQIEILRLVTKLAGGRGLIVLPLGVRQEFRRDGQMLGVDIKFIRRIEEAGETGLYMTNYETVRDGKIDPNQFLAVTLDEASVLRSYGSKTYQTFLSLFDGVRYRFVATATPSPNRYKELIHYAGFLGIMDTGQALTRFFQRDSTQANNLTLYPHKEKEFWLWLNSWAIFLQRPSDLGYSDEGYALPPMSVIYHEVQSDIADGGVERDGQTVLFKDAAIGVVSASKEKRETLNARVAKVMEILNVEGIGAGTQCAAQADEGVSRVSAEIPARAVSSRQGAGEGISGNAGAEGLHGCVREEEQGEAQACSKAEDVRARAGAVDGASGAPGASVPDLPEVPCLSSDAIDRPLPSDGRGAGSALPEVQRRDRAAGGEHGQPGAGDRVPEHSSASRNQQCVIWCDLNDEQQAIERELIAAGITVSSLYGSQTLDEREKLLDDWKSGRTTVFLSKPTMYGSGVNLQQCSRMIFSGITFKFNDTIQAIHRVYRFLQSAPVSIHIIYAESEREVLRALQAKWEAHNRMVENMSEIIRQHGLDKLSAAEVLSRTIGVERIEARGEGWQVANNDCVEEAKLIADNSVDLIVTSIPFSNHYEYTPSYNDFGHTDSDDHFFQQMDFLTPELLRILKPGRVYACHTKDRILFGNVTGMGMPTVNPFHARTLFHTMSHGFAYMGMITVNTDVVRENNQTYRLGWTENCKDGTKMGVGSPEYILLFRKLPSDTSKAYADERVTKDKEDYTRARWQVDAHAFWRSSGDRLLTPEELAALGPDMLAKAFTEWTLKNVYDYETHIRIGEALEKRGALPSTFMSLAPGAHDAFTWHDVNRMRTLNGDQTKKGLENHICPLQFDIVDRLIKRFSNEGELVFDPFGGLFTVPYRALKLGRRGRASELNPGYFLDGIKYLQAMEREIATPTMFDIFERQGEAA